MNYGMKRWTAGYLCGCSLMMATWFLLEERPMGLTMLGLAIVLFFADYRIKEPHI